MHEICCVVTCNVTRKWKGSEPTMRSNGVERKWGHQGSPLFHLWRSHNRASFCCPVSLCLLRLPRAAASRSNHLRAARLGASSMSSGVTYEAFWICTLWNFSFSNQHFVMASRPEIMPRLNKWADAGCVHFKIYDPRRVLSLICVNTAQNLTCMHACFVCPLVTVLAMLYVCYWKQEDSRGFLQLPSCCPHCKHSP